MLTGRRAYVRGIDVGVSEGREARIVGVMGAGPCISVSNTCKNT